MNHKGVLLLHGFAGNIEEVKPLQDYLKQKGYIVECPLLTGHGRTKKELSETTREDWIASAEEAYLELSKKCDKVFAVGFSMGGLLAVNLWNYGFSGLVTVNMPVYYWNLKYIAANLIRNFTQYRKKYFAASTDKSLSSLLEFQKLLTETKPLLGNIACRTLVVQVLDDDTVHHRSADYILKRVRAESTSYRPSRGGHLIFQGETGLEVCRVIEDFIRTG
jgi:carboxylesterase